MLVACIYDLFLLKHIKLIFGTFENLVYLHNNYYKVSCPNFSAA